VEYQASHISNVSQAREGSPELATGALAAGPYALLIVRMPSWSWDWQLASFQQVAKVWLRVRSFGASAPRTCKHNRYHRSRLVAADDVCDYQMDPGKGCVGACLCHCYGGSSRVSLNSRTKLKSVLMSTWRLGCRSSRYCKPEIGIMRYYSA
jgi:hypothetical protein